MLILDNILHRFLATNKILLAILNLSDENNSMFLVLSLFKEDMNIQYHFMIFLSKHFIHILYISPVERKFVWRTYIVCCARICQVFRFFLCRTQRRKMVLKINKSSLKFLQWKINKRVKMYVMWVRENVIIIFAEERTFHSFDRYTYMILIPSLFITKIIPKYSEIRLNYFPYYYIRPIISTSKFSMVIKYSGVKNVWHNKKIICEQQTRDFDIQLGEKLWQKFSSLQIDSNQEYGEGIWHFLFK